MLEILSYGFMQRAFIAGTAMALFTGIISVFIVLRRVSFLGSGISHAAFGGVAIGFLAGINPLLTALIYCIAVAFAIEVISARGKLAEDTAIGIFFSGSMAMGVVLIGLSKSYTVDLFGYLFGSILAISKEEACMTVIMAAAVIAIFAIIMKDLLFITFNEELAIVNGIPVRFIKALFLISMAIAIVIGIKVVGIILISALLVIPGATAKLLTRRFHSMLALSALIAVTSTISGLTVSYVYDLAPGGTIVIMLSLFFAIAFIRKILT
ncbi:MAG: metal ABC transporter permease [Thermodesulfovibrionales bacterium]